MKYLITLLAGLATGVGLVAGAIYMNPVAKQNPLVRLDADLDNRLELVRDAPARAALALVGGERRIGPRFPDGIAELWEPVLADTEVELAVLADELGEPRALGLRLSSLSEATRPLGGELLVHSAWHVYLPGRGSVFLGALENHWPLAREVVLGAWRDERNLWSGRFVGDVTVGPGATGEGLVVGGHGEFSGRVGQWRELVDISRYSLDNGPLEMRSSLTLGLPGAAERIADSGRREE